MKKKTLTAVLLFFILFSFCYAQQGGVPVEFYAVTSSSGDEEMIKLTQDLLFSYVTEMEGYRLIDKRDTSYTAEQVSSDFNGYLFWADIEENNGWVFTLYLRSAGFNVTKTAGKTYDNYYRILLESRNLVLSLFDSLKAEVQGTAPPFTVTIDAPPDGAAQNTNAPYGTVPITAPEILSGNWKGEAGIEKIVILRGGRGVVIFTNGTSMNISVTIRDGVMTATQQGRSNAGFYPELSRVTALVAAETAPPISWRMQLSRDNSALFGEKTTIEPVYQGDAVVSTKTVQIPAVWQRQ
ncbi:MAG: hypothetical protein LBU99_05420 [Spirochaetaceae bacterium]|jgi:hypothetical protein|nr:hypothetical protein [Spirochaetaceae bacterium]